MFEALSEKLNQAFRRLTGQHKLSEENMAEALKEVRTALLGADVHFKVVRDFIERVKTAAVGQEVLEGVNPGQMVIKIINDELVQLLGQGSAEIPTKRPLKILMVGLHGSGKTTSTVKLARWLRQKHNLRPHLVACDVYRPAAIDQLETLAKGEQLPVFADRASKDVPAIGERGLKAALQGGADCVIWDTAGRLQIDAGLIEEVKRLRERVQPDEVLLVADSALGQEAVNVSKAFHEAVGLTGIILTKLDGDARGGAALSMKSITGVPIKFAGLGEKPGDFDLFYPERMASRILGMGDVVSLVEKAQEAIDEKEAAEMAEKLRKSDFNFEDMLEQFRQIRKMGDLQGLLNFLPGAGKLKVEDAHLKQMKRTEAIILSMTKKERRNPQLMQSGSRRLRVANGAGVLVRDVNQLIKNFGQMRDMMKAMRGSKGKAMMKQMEAQLQGGGLPGMPALPGGRGGPTRPPMPGGPAARGRGQPGKW